jgi:hypothetical protein
MNVESPLLSNVVNHLPVPICHELTVSVYGREDTNVVVIQQRSPVLKVI